MNFKFDSKLVRNILIVLCVLLSLQMYIQRRKRNNYKEAAKLPFYNTSVEQVADGTYSGKIYTSFLHVQLDVTVADKKITGIEIIENAGSCGNRVAPIIDEMIAQNTSVVPAIKGEELASIVFVACVDDALRKGVENQ